MKKFYNLGPDISNTDISKYPLMSMNIALTNFIFFLHFESYEIKLLISEIKFFWDKNIFFEIISFSSLR